MADLQQAEFREEGVAAASMKRHKSVARPRQNSQAFSVGVFDLDL